MANRKNILCLSMIVLSLSLLLQGCGGNPSTPSNSSSASPAAIPPPPSTPPGGSTPNNQFLFGMHIHHIDAGTPWPSVPALPAWRLWDAGVSWRDLEPARGVFDFALLDSYVALAEKHNTKLLLTFGFTPQWASERPDEPSNAGPGGAAPPANLSDWDQFVTAVSTRYKGKIEAYEILNEPNLAQYFSGTVADQFAMLSDAYKIIKSIDPAATVLSPGYTENKSPDLDQLLAMGGAQYIDAIAFHLYDFPAKPEAIQSRINFVEAAMAKHNVNKPIWDTEIGFGPGQTFTDEDQQAAYFARTILLHWRNGIPRAYWYAWDNHGWAHLWMTEKDSTTLTKAGVAFSVLYSWISSSTLSACSTQADTLNVCDLTLSNGAPAHIVLMISGSATYTLPSTWSVTSVEDLEGNIQKIIDPSFTATESPVLLF